MLNNCGLNPGTTPRDKSDRTGPVCEVPGHNPGLLQGERGSSPLILRPGAGKSYFKPATRYCRYLNISEDLSPANPPKRKKLDDWMELKISQDI